MLSVLETDKISFHFFSVKEKASYLVDDTARKKGGRFFPVCMEVQRHESIWTHWEVIIHGQHLDKQLF